MKTFDQIADEVAKENGYLSGYSDLPLVYNF